MQNGWMGAAGCGRRPSSAHNVTEEATMSDQLGSDVQAQPEGDVPAPQENAPEPTRDTGGPTAPGQPAAQPRPHRGRTIALRVIGVLVVLGLVVAGVWVSQAHTRRQNAEAGLAAAASLLEEAESDLLIVDEAVQAVVSSEIATQAAEALVLADSVRAQAVAARDALDAMGPDLPEDLAALAEALRISAQARIEMMDEAPVILDADYRAAMAIPHADRAVAEIKAAEERAAKAAAEFNKHTEAGVKASTEHTTRMREHLQAARSELETATVQLPDADFGPFLDYIDAKIELVAESQRIDKLWLDGKIEESNKLLDEYNKRDAEIVAMAADLPASVRDPIADAYERLTADARDRYYAARERARKAGEDVRTIRRALGTTG